MRIGARSAQTERETKRGVAVPLTGGGPLLCVEKRRAVRADLGAGSHTDVGSATPAVRPRQRHGAGPQAGRTHDAIASLAARLAAPTTDAAQPVASAASRRCGAGRGLARPSRKGPAGPAPS